MRKTILRAGALLGALLVAAPAFAQEITFWSWRQEDTAVYQQVIDSFEKANPGITVKYEAFVPDQYNTILSTALSGGTGPDVMMVRAHGALETVAAGGYLMPLDAKTVPGLDTLPAPALAAETSGGKIYAVPFASQTMLIIYNKALFDKFGIAEPKTWDDLTKAAQTLKANGIFGFANGTATAWQNETIVSAIGSSLIGKDFYNDLMAGKTDFNDPRYVNALAKLKEMSAYFPDGFQGLDYPSAQQLFASGLAGMFAGGSFELATFKGLNPDLEMGVIPAPVAKDGDEPLVGLYFDGGYAGNAKTQHAEAVQKFLSYLTTKDFGQVFANKLNNVSPIPGVTFDNPLLQKVAGLDDHSIPYIMLVHFRYKEPSGSVLLQTAVQKMLAGESTPEDAAKSVTDGIATYYEPFQKLKK
ncbi:MAG TPA: extracellular solute-binding protein [Devosiaceae bacterium]|jgi:raffinose/stachyose/melibiose transport system substrate-binding protein